MPHYFYHPETQQLPFLKNYLLFFLCEIQHPMLALSCFSISIWSTRNFKCKNPTQCLHHFHIILAHIIIHSSSKFQCHPLLQLSDHPMNLNTFYGVPNSAHVTKDSVSASIYGVPPCTSMIESRKGKGHWLIPLLPIVSKASTGVHTWIEDYNWKTNHPICYCGNNAPYQFPFFPVPWSTLTPAGIFCLTVSLKSFVAKKPT